MRSAIRPGTRLGMPVELWPKADRAAWTHAFRPLDIFDEQPSGTAMRPASRLVLETSYARWLAWLIAHDPKALSEAPGPRASPERVVAYLRDIDTELAAVTVRNYAAHLRKALQLLSPGIDLGWLTPLLHRLERRCRSNRPLRPTISANTLYSTGLEMMEAGDRLATSNVSAGACLYTHGLIIAFMARRPLRLKNMIGLDLNLHLRQNSNGFRVELGVDDMKTGRPFACPVPDSLAPAFTRYLSVYRPILLAQAKAGQSSPGPEATTVFISARGKAFTSEVFEDMITRETLKRLGQRLTPHDFRHCVATTIAEAAPEEAQIIRIILGHSTSATADRYYIHAKSQEAALKFQATLAAEQKLLQGRMNQIGSEEQF